MLRGVDPPVWPADPEVPPDPLRIVVRDVTGQFDDVDEESLDGLTDIWESFPTDAFAGLITGLLLRTGDVWLFGMVEHQGGDCWMFREPIIRTIVWPNDEGQVRKAASELERWYAETIRGQTIRRGGRPVGTTTDGPTTDERRAYARACQELAPRDRGPTAVAIRMAADLNRPITPGWVHYWMERGAFPRDEKAPRRTRRQNSPLSE